MPKIHRLSSDLANQIAAGEVVERPASVIKELVENALDAGATRIDVEIDRGGLDRICVTDDGEGMSPDDAVRSLERHATSKIGSVEDLTHLRTFGFRGEALPSIGSVSRLTIRTKTRECAEGTELNVDGGGPARVRPAGCAAGTSVQVDELFFNVPARRKFLKSVGTESAHGGEAVLLAALSRPDVAFFLKRDGKVVREYLRASSREERAARAMTEPKLHPCMASRGPLHIEAHLSPPERARSGATALYLFVNGRPIRDRQLARAVAQSYGSVLEPGRYPVGVVYVDLPSDLVDVNVHPQKAEVRFADGRAIFDALTRELHTILAKAFAIPSLGPMSRRRLPPTRSQSFEPPYQRDDVSGNAVQPFANVSGDAVQPLANPPPNFWPLAEGLNANPFDAPKPASENQETLFSAPAFYGSLKFIAQMRGTYLVCEGGDGLYILDQHAAAERVTFHRLRASYRDRKMATQQLLIPEIVQLSLSDLAAIEEHASNIESLGLELRVVGELSVAVHGVPALLVRARPERLVRDLVAELTRSATRPFGATVDLAFATMACHGSVRAGDSLSHEEARALLGALDSVDFSGHCPHGRPVVTRLGFDELERRVGRA